MANSQTFTLNIKALFDASDVKAKVGDIQNTLQKLKLPDKLSADLNKSFANVNKALDDFTTKTEKGIKTKTDANGIAKSFDVVTKELTNLDNLLIKVQGQLGDGVDLSKIIKIPDNAKNQITQLQTEIEALQKQISDINVSKIKSLEDILKQVKTKGSSEHGDSALKLFQQGDIDGAIAELDKFIEKLRTFKQTANVTDSISALEQMRKVMSNTRDETTNIYNEISQKSQEQANITANAVNEVTTQLKGQTDAFHQSSTAASGLTGEINKLTTNQAQFVREIDQVKSRIQYFFGLSNAINLVKRAIRGAVDTIKELDKAMTETAVVTDFSVGDMWEQLPEYTKRANELGVSTLAAYQAATLYYQQGLKTEEVNALSVETLKMARIAGLDAAEATDRMTNALRGFNMELTEANAARVDDVYSELAANTASNVDEISTAMTKVASLAHNANMEFETTSAFLAQIIETTRESAETAGTALKTVVARFSEVKKLVDTDQLRGQDEEGQVIDVNRVGQALRTAGIDLNKYFLGEVGLDDIFMELAEKWDSLTSVQQRYIATQAAGSRQQSRFIALMSDYARTQELVGKAYNAEGASARQFAKTQESLESKLARLKNAWNEFLMGLTNSGLVKGFVDVLTNLLNAINKITSAFGEGGSAIAKWGVALGAIFGGKALLQSGGLLDNAIGALTGNTILGSMLGRAGIGGRFTGAITDRKTSGIGNYIKSLISRRQEAKNRLSDSWRYNPEYMEAKSTYRKSQSAENLRKLGQARQAAVKGAKESATANAPSYFYLMREDFSKKIKNATTAVKTFGDAFSKSGLGQWLLKGFGAGGSTGAAAGFGAIAGALGTVTAAALAAGIAIKGVYDASPAGQVKNAEKLADAISKISQSAQKTSDEFKHAAESYKNYNDEINNANTIEESKAAKSKRNDYINSLLESNNEFAKYVEAIQENGQIVLSINEEKLQKEIDQTSLELNNINITSDFSRAALAGQRADLYETQSNKIKGTSTEDESKRYQLQLSESNARLEESTLASQAYLRILNNSGLEDEVANKLSKALGNAFNEDTWAQDLATAQMGVSSLWNEIGEKGIDAEYEKITGQTFEKGTSDVEKRSLLAAAQVSKFYSDNTSAVIDLLKGSDSGLYKNILSAMDGSELANIDLLSDTSSIISDLGLDSASSQIETLAKTLGFKVEDITKAINDNVKIARKQQQERLKTNTEKLRTGGTSWGTIEQFAQLDFDKQQIAQSLFESIDTSWLTDSVSESIIQGIQVGGQDFADAFKNIDLSNPIEGYDKLTKLTSNTNPRIKETAQLLLDAGKSTDQFSAANQLAYFYTSENYDAVAESLEKLKGENENISSSNIIEAAKSSSELATMLDNGTMSAKALATALSALSTGDIDISNLSNSIIAALNAMDDLDGAVKRTIDDLNNFDPGYDENDVTGFIDKVLKNANENIEKGAWGNNVMGNYMEKIFGEFKFEGDQKDYGAAYKAWLQNNVKWLEANKDNMFSAWNDFAGENDQRILQSGEKTASILEQNGKMIIDAGGMTTQELTDAMVATGELTRTQAEMMIADFKNYSADFAAEMAANDLPGAIQAWMGSLPKLDDGTKIYDEAELSTLATLLGTTVDNIKAQIDKLKDAADEYRGIKWTNENGDRTAESIKNALNEAGADVTSKRDIPRSNLQEDTGIFDYDKMKQAYQKLGIPQLFESDFNKVAAESGKFFANIFGKGREEVAIQEGETAGEAYARAYQQAVNQDLADKMGEVFKEAFQEIDITINTTDSDTKLDETQGKLDTIKDGAEGTVSIVDHASDQLKSITGYLSSIKDKTVTVTVKQKMTGQQAATGGIVKSFADGSGTRYMQPGFALTGEEGPEIVWNKEQGYAYITGKNGAEFQNLQPGDRVFNAAETQRIFRNSSFANGGIVPSYAEGYEGATKPKDKKKSSGGGGSGDDKDDEWKNDLDWLYNVMENIAELERQQNIYQEEYEDLLKDQTKTGQDLYKMLIKQLGNLYAQLDHQTYTLERREQEMREFMDTTNDQDDYLWYNWEDRTIEIDWDAIDKITDQEQYDHIKDLISEAEEIQDKMDDAEDAIIDVENQIQELENIWRDTFTDFEERVLDAIVKMYQSVIDNYSELNDTLNETNTNILDAINREISLQRQIRDNTKTEQEIADNEAQLAYMQRDTTGGNKLEALQMGKDLDDQRQDYQDNLIDQAIQKLQDDNDMAAQQREKQIEIMQAQLDYQSENGEFNAYIRELMESAVDPDGHLATDSDLYRLLAEQENIDAMTKVQRDVWEEELNGTFKEVAAFLLKEQNEAEGTYFTAVTAAFNGISETFDKAFHGSYSQGGAGSGSSSGGSSGGGGKSPSSTKNQGDCPKGGNHNWVNRSTNSAYWKECSKCGTRKDYHYRSQTQGKTSSSTSEKAILSPSYVNNKKNVYQNHFKYKAASGGLIDYTGGLWIDGTPSEPEYVLNARQTDAFLKLADVLPAAMNTSGQNVSNTFGATTNNVVINVDKIDSDYSVDQMVDRVKEKLFESGSYRNNNVLSLMR